MVEVTLHVPIKSNIVDSLFTSCDRMFGSDGPSFAKYMSAVFPSTQAQGFPFRRMAFLTLESHIIFRWRFSWGLLE